MSIPFSIRNSTEPKLDNIRKTAESEEITAKYQHIAATFLATDWIADAAEEAAELAAALNKLNRGMGVGLSTPKPFDELYDAVIEEYADLVGTLETALKVLAYQKGIAPATKFGIGPGPLNAAQRAEAMELIRAYKNTRFVQRNNDRLAMAMKKRYEAPKEIPGPPAETDTEWMENY